MIWQGIGIAPDRYAFVLLFVSLFFKKTRGFFLDFLPFLFILISYDFLRGFADTLGQEVHFFELINFDRALFGGILPTSYLQGLLFNPSNPAWYDYLATILYFLHFALPLSFAFFLWVYNKSYFKKFVTAILILSYAGWITYVIYPAAPPWLAAEKGYIHGISKIMDQTLKAFPERLSVPTIYHNINPNPVAAVPSMHAAYPLLILFFALKFFKKKGYWFLPYVLAVWISIVYLGEHYVIDLVIGAVYALVSYMVAIHVLHTVKFHSWLKRMRGRLLGSSAQSASQETT